jgi:hypothetical protein
VEANSTGGQGSRRAVAPSDDDDDITTPAVFLHNLPRYNCNFDHFRS